MLKIFNENNAPDSGRVLHVGVMMSRRTLLGLRTKWAEAFPYKEAIASIFSSSETYNCLHYADYDKVPDPNLVVNLFEAISYGGERISALQLDIPWPDPSAIAYAKKKCGKNLEVILQIGRRCFEMVDNNKKLLTSRILDYYGIVDRVLLDKSCGEGLPMDPLKLLPFIRYINERLPRLGIVVAGGLGPRTMHLLVPIVAEYPKISIDAQGQLRLSGNAMDPVDWDLAAVYLIKALQVLR